MPLPHLVTATCESRRSLFESCEVDYRPEIKYYYCCLSNFVMSVSRVCQYFNLSESGDTIEETLIQVNTQTIPHVLKNHSQHEADEEGGVSPG